LSGVIYVGVKNAFSLQYDIPKFYLNMLSIFKIILTFRVERSVWKFCVSWVLKCKSRALMYITVWQLVLMFLIN